MVLFVGTSPGPKSAQIGHYFAGASNMFWKLLYESKLTEERLNTKHDRKVKDYCYGLTDVVKRPTHSTTELKKDDGNGAQKRLNKIIEKNKPKIVAFVGKTGFRYYLEDTYLYLEYGIQDVNIASAHVFLLPSTSGASFADTKYDEKLFWFKKLRHIIKKLEI